MYTPSRHFADFHIAGFAYYDGVDVIEQLKPGCELSLAGEPDNPHDPDAVAIMLGKTKLGYVPREANSAISQLIYFGHADTFEAKVVQYDPETHPSRQVRVAIKVRDAR